MTDAKTSAKGFNYSAKIGSLIAMSEDESLTTEARASYRLKAEQLMREYRVSEEEAIAKDEFSILPGRFEIVLLRGDLYRRSDFRDAYLRLFREIANHTGIKVRFEYAYGGDDPRALKAVGYGYDMDVRFAEFLWTASHLVFVTRIDASVNPELSDQENCYYLRNSGKPRNEIAYALWGSDPKDGAAHGKVQRLYLAECAKRGEKPRVQGRGVQVAIYRQAYADSFLDQFGWRLREARDAADSEGGALELPGRKERVAEAFYAEWPDARPMSAEERARLQREAQEAEDNCPDCKTSKSKTGKCRRHRPYEVTAADVKRWERTYSSPEARAGKLNGAEAARAVDFSRSAGPRKQRTEGAPERPAIQM